MNFDIERIDGRKYNALRKVKIIPNYLENPWGSVRIEMGKTIVHCGATVLEEIPKWMKQENEKISGWITSEYSMLPYCSDGRIRREASAGKVSGRTQEIQRLIGRSLRAAVDLTKLGEKTVGIDCEVLQADGGTRTAAITGGYVALELALQKCVDKGILKEKPIINQIGAISVGIIDNTPYLDLCYEEDSKAEVDMNVIMTRKDEFVEIQSTAEGKTFNEDALKAMLKLAKKGIHSLFKLQNKALTQGM